MQEIKDLYRNSCSYLEGFGFSDNSAWVEIQENLRKSLQDLSDSLTEKQKEQLEQIYTLYSQSHDMEMERMFLYGFRQGARLIMDVVAE